MGTRSTRAGIGAAATTASIAALALLVGAPTATAAPELDARGSAEQVQVTGATPGAKVKLRRDGATVATQQGASSAESSSARSIRAAATPSARRGSGPGRSASSATRGRPPDTDVYDQAIGDGYGYLTTRDGTELAINVHLPGPPENGPYPTMIEYSGYAYAQPGVPESGIQPIAQLLGYAVVDVNMRGTGCSGGAFDFFEPLQALDGYDVIETIARQPWVANGEVGMIGVSYGGISQLFVAAKRPPSLAAITPLSVIDSTMTTLYPGGILNTGFALEWGQDRVDDAQPAGPTTGQPWAWQRIEGGDGVCAANQELHPEAANLIEKIRRNDYYRPKIADPLSPVEFVDEIDVPVFMACQWTDEQTGGHCPTLAGAMTGTRKKWFTFTNGVHTDALDPEIFNRWYDFLQIYVAKEKPEPNAGGVGGLAPLLYQTVMGVPGVTLPDDPIQHEPDLAAAKAAFEAQRPVRILFDNGAGGAPVKPVARLRALVQELPGPRHRAAVVVSGRRRQARREAARRGRPVHLGRRRPPADQLHRQHRQRRPLDRPPRIRLDPEPGGDRARLREQAARPRHRRAR